MAGLAPQKQGSKLFKGSVFEHHPAPVAHQLQEWVKRRPLRHNAHRPAHHLRRPSRAPCCLRGGECTWQAERLGLMPRERAKSLRGSDCRQHRHSPRFTCRGSLAAGRSFHRRIAKSSAMMTASSAMASAHMGSDTSCGLHATLPHSLASEILPLSPFCPCHPSSPRHLRFKPGAKC